MNMIFSAIIPASEKDLKSTKLKELIESIKAQEFPQDQIEILVITNYDPHEINLGHGIEVGYSKGDSEQAKAIGIKKAKGEICAMFCADNYITDNGLFKYVYFLFKMYHFSGVYSKFYKHLPSDNSLNRYFSLIGNNDPICFYLGKSDRRPHYENNPDEQLTILGFKDQIPSLGDNGFFYRRDAILKSDLDNYYPMDNAKDIQSKGEAVYARYNCSMIWHRTSDSYFSFLKKRYIYARNLYSDRTNRRWKMLDTRKDYWRLFLFILSVITVIPILFTSIRGYLKVRDPAWFWHYPLSFGFLITYTILAIRNLFKHGNLFQKRCLLPA